MFSDAFHGLFTPSSGKISHACKNFMSNKCEIYLKTVL